MNEKTKFTLVDSGGLDNEHWGIQIDDGPFAGVVFNFGVVKFVGEDDDGSAIIQFEYDIIEDSYGFAEEDKANFESTLSNILSTIFEDSVKEQPDGTNRDNSTEESDLL